MRFQPSRHSYGAVDAPVGGTPTWAQLTDYPVLKKGDADAGNKAGKSGAYVPPASGGALYNGLVAEVQRLLGITADGYFGGDTEKAVLAANARAGENSAYLSRIVTDTEMVWPVTWAYLYKVLPVDTPAASTTTTAAASESAATAVPGTSTAATTGTTASAKRGGAAPVKRTGEKVSARVAARQAKQQSREMWKNIALWGGVAVVGIGAVTLIVKSLGKEGT